MNKFKTIAATGMNFGMNKLTSLNYTRKEFQAPSTSGMGVAGEHVMLIDVKNRSFVPHFEALPFDPGTLPGINTLDLCSTRPDLLTNQE